MKAFMNNSNNLPFGVGSILALTYNLFNFLSASPLVEKIFETAALAIVGVVVSGISTYLCKKYFPKIFKK